MDGWRAGCIGSVGLVCLLSIHQGKGLFGGKSERRRERNSRCLSLAPRRLLLSHLILDPCPQSTQHSLAIALFVVASSSVRRQQQASVVAEQESIRRRAKEKGGEWCRGRYGVCTASGKGRVPSLRLATEKELP